VRGDRRPWSLEPVAGRIAPGETPEATAHRESLEETGLALRRLELVARYYPSPGAVSEYLHSYVGIADLPDGAEGIGGEAGEHEDIRSIVLPFEALMELLASGEAENGPLILSAQWLAAHRSRLRGRA
jgi:8-oxo-dGTP pyrophosphatase MutT (NUDIX family)